MAIICHNTDLGDGWGARARRGYFHEFSERSRTRWGSNIVTYAMTH